MDKILGKVESAYLGGGCFWCLEAVYAKVKGVQKVTSGYAGGDFPSDGKSPTYEMVSRGNTRYAETVEIFFDSEKIFYADILRIFFTLHDPTTLNRQGNDIGSQYRSIIFFKDGNQKKTAEKIIQELESKKIYNQKIVTELVSFSRFFPAEEYHQKYFKKNPTATYCQIVIEPKVAKLREKFKNFFMI